MPGVAGHAGSARQPLHLVGCAEGKRARPHAAVLIHMFIPKVRRITSSILRSPTATNPTSRIFGGRSTRHLRALACQCLAINNQISARACWQNFSIQLALKSQPFVQPSGGVLRAGIEH